jgi:hypothetical protein
MKPQLSTLCSILLVVALLGACSSSHPTATPDIEATVQARVVELLAGAAL